MAVKQQTPTTEAARIADQLRRAFDGTAWHGPSLMELLDGVDAATAAAKPLAKVHSIWELVLHIAAWDAAGYRRLSGEKIRGARELDFLATQATVTRGVPGPAE